MLGFAWLVSGELKHSPVADRDNACSPDTILCQKTGDWITLGRDDVRDLSAVLDYVIEKHDVDPGVRAQLDRTPVCASHLRGFRNGHVDELRSRGALVPYD